MCFSDFYAIKIYESLKALSLKIPEHVSVMGICAYPGGHLLKPPLSTVDFEYEKIGEMAFEIIENSGSWFNKKGTKVPEVISPHKIIVRESVKEI
jgi:DNA-binding LacI/PurR family transcriptional regulator